MSDTWPGTPEGEQVFAEYLARLECGDAPDFEELCARRSELAGELREMYALWLEVEPSLGSTSEEVPDDPRYDVRSELGRGGMGVVLEVFDHDLERTLAMKVVRDGASASQRVSRFLNEAKITGALTHPGIPPIHELGIDANGRAYFTMPLVEGQTLEEFLDREPPTTERKTRALGILHKVCEAMAFAHSRGIVHRDLKPANVMIGSFGETYVMDWGLAGRSGAAGDTSLRTTAAEPSAGMTREGDVLGTPAYMAPEQAAGQQERVGFGADVYSVGAMLYHVLAGRAPYTKRGHTSTGAEVLERVRGGPPERLAPQRSSVPAELVAICEKAMARDAEDRYRDMGEMARDLGAFLEGRVVHAYERGAWPELKKWILRNRGLTVATACTALVALAGLGGVGYVQAREKQKVLSLSDHQLLSELERDADDLWPALPGRTRDIDGWLTRAALLRARLPGHEQRLRETAWNPEDAEARWQERKLEELVAGLRDFAQRTVPDVERRRTLAETVVSETIESHQQAWDRLDIEPQVGLIPLGPDPLSGLEEFAHWQTGSIPERRSNGTLRLPEDHGIVLVLVPGGTYRMGAGEGDPGASDLDTPAHEVALAPFFISKYEMTQSQWERFTGENPSVNIGANELSPRRPVENVSWVEAELVLSRLDLELPTEAQWEYAARAGTTETWWGGDDPTLAREAESLGGYGTLPVGDADANPFGLYDVLGNVVEWCRDSYGEYSAGWPLASEDAERLVKDSAVRVFRGAHFSSPPADCRSALRMQASPERRLGVLGVRPSRPVRERTRK